MRWPLRLSIALIVVLLAGDADAHVGSPDVFFEGDAGPYPVYVTIRTPDVIPGVATIELRTSAPDVTRITVVPMRLTGPGSERPPAPDVAERSPQDPQFFTASLWLMEHGSLQVRISVDGARGPGVVAVPVPAVAQRTLAMDRGLGALLFVLMAVLAVAVTSILAAAVRDAALDPGASPDTRGRRRARIAGIVVGGGVVGMLALGNLWWDAEARNYARSIAQPWHLAPVVDGCRLHLRIGTDELLPDHGHLMHVFAVRVPGFDQLAHLHPTREGEDFVAELPPLAAGRYALFADVVFANGFPLTGTAEFDAPDLTSCAPPSGDDAMWTGRPGGELAGGGRIVWDRPPVLRAGTALALRFHVEDAGGAPSRLEPYMGMAGHAAVVRDDRSVFTHLHPSGSVAMPALDLALGGVGVHRMSHDGHVMLLPPDVAFPYGFPQPGTYHLFVQVKRAGRIETARFDAVVE